jgi:hypothetical protein
MKHISLKDSENRNRKGDFAEYYAVTWLWDQGYEVFQNSGCTGPIDMIAIKDKETTLIDVKTYHERSGSQKGQWNDCSGGGRTKQQKQLGVQILAFNPHTRGLTFIKHRT